MAPQQHRRLVRCEHRRDDTLPLAGDWHLMWPMMLLLTAKLLPLRPLQHESQ